ncbi:Hpt domain-containing protein [Pseudoalteromonas phenolica]
MSASQESSEDDSTLSDENKETSDELSISSTQQAKNESSQFENVVDHEPKAEISKTDTPDVSTAFDSDINWSEERPKLSQAAIEDDVHTIDIDALTETDNAHLAWQEPETEETKSTTTHEDNYDLDLSLQSHEADNLEWQEETSSTPSSHSPSEETLDLSQFSESDSDLEWKDHASNAQVDELEHEINIDNIEVDNQNNIDWQNLNDIDETASISSEDKTETAITDTLTEETEQVGSAIPSQASALTGSLSSISLESSWEATPATQASDDTIPTPSFGLAPEGTSQDALNPVSTQEHAVPEIKVLVEDTIEVDTPNEVKAIEPESSEVEPDIQATTEDDLPAEESIEEPQVDIATLAVVDIDMFDKYVNHDEAKKLRFFRMYLEQSSELIRDIFANVMTREQEKIISDCHQLKSISKTVGAMQVAEIAIQFEQACKDRELNIDELISFRDKLDDYYTDAMMFMQDFIKQRSE